MKRELEDLTFRSFGESIRALRIYRKMTLGDVAKATGMTRSSVSKSERGERPPPSFERIEIMAETLEACPASLHAIAMCESHPYLFRTPESFAHLVNAIKIGKLAT